MSEQAETATYVDEESDQVREGWHVQTLEDADWCLRRIAELEAEAAENARVAETNILRIQARAVMLNDRSVRGVEFFTMRLREYAEAHRAELLRGGKKKSRTLVHGSIGWRKVGGTLKVSDPDELLAWAQAQPVELELVRITEAPAVAQIQKYFKATGEVPPGVEFVEETEEFQVKPIEEMGHGKQH